MPSSTKHPISGARVGGEKSEIRNARHKVRTIMDASHPYSMAGTITARWIYTHRPVSEEQIQKRMRQATNVSIKGKNNLASGGSASADPIGF